MIALVASAGRAAAQDTTHVGGSDTLPPAGFGTLKQEDVSIEIDLPNLVLRIMPLAEPVIRLLSPDAYASLHRLLEIRAPAIDSVARRRGIGHPTAFMVTFFALQDRVPFSPDEVTVTSRNQMFRPIAALPLTPGWSSGLLTLRSTQSAVYVLEQIPVLEPLQISYGGVTNGQWEATLRTLDQERAQVVARAAARH
jgi:hypothetical protein